MPAEQPPVIGEIKFFGAQYADALTAGDPNTQTAAFYGLQGLARQLVGDVAAASQEADTALGMAAQAETERDEALRAAQEARPVDESEELQRLRGQVAELTGQLATAQADSAQQSCLRRRAEEERDLAATQHARELRASQRKLARATGALTVAGQHACSLDGVPDAVFAGVVGSHRVYLVNTLPGTQGTIARVEQARNGGQLILRVRPTDRGLSNDGYTEVEVTSAQAEAIASGAAEPPEGASG